MQNYATSRTLGRNAFVVTIGGRWSWRKTVLLIALLVLPSMGTWGQAQGPDQPSFELSVHDGLLSANITNAPLREVMAELARQVPLRVFVADDVSDDNISVTFENLPFETGLRRILQGKNYLLIHERSPSPSAENGLSVAQIRVMPAGEAGPLPEIGAEATPSPMDIPATVEQPQTSLAELMTEALQAEQPDARVDALQALVNRQQEGDVWPTIVAALGDQDPIVRRVALVLLEQAQASIPVEPLARMALADPDAELRMEALRHLVEAQGEGALTYLQQAVQDPDPRVSAQARNLLEETLAGPGAGAGPGTEEEFEPDFEEGYEPGFEEEYEPGVGEEFEPGVGEEFEPGFEEDLMNENL